jgi:tripartite-type tricarboxylate transporter receptor subunit TctC
MKGTLCLNGGASPVNRRLRRRACKLGLLIGILGVVAPAVADVAQNYPLRPVRMIVPFAPGGGSDIVGRIVAQGLSERWGQTVVVDNRPGAGSTVGTAIAARAPADGHTIMVSSSAIAFSPSLYKNLPFDIRRDFASLSLLARQSSILAVAANVRAASVKELIALGRANNGTLTFGSAGVGSATHLGGELLRYSAKMDMTHVPYKSAGLAMTALLAGEVQVLLTNGATVLPHLKAGRIKALATSGRHRSKLAPDLPTVAEGGLAGFEYDTWYAMLAPAKLPGELGARINADIVRVLRDPNHAKRLLSQEIEIVASSSSALAEYLNGEIERWSKVIRAAGIPMQ